MPMSAERVVQLCEQSAAAIREDIDFVQSGGLKLENCAGVDVSPEVLARMRAVLSNLQEIIDGCGCNCP
jgi:hypothetical protein